MVSNSELPTSIFEAEVEVGSWELGVGVVDSKFELLTSNFELGVEVPVPPALMRSAFS